MLFNYIQDVSAVIKEYHTLNKIIIVDTIEVLNEPLVKFQSQYNSEYSLRSDAIKNKICPKSIWHYDENFAPGWLQFVNINDICQIYKFLKSELPEVKLMISECNLEDADKLNYFMDNVIDYMIEFEEDNRTIIFDSIGTQMHLQIDSFNASIDNMLK